MSLTLSVFSPKTHPCGGEEAWGGAGARVPWGDIQVCWMLGQIWPSTASSCSQVLRPLLPLPTRGILTVPWVFVHYKHNYDNVIIPVDKAISISDIEPLDCAKNFGGWKGKIKEVTLKHNKIQESYKNTFLPAHEATARPILFP